ncbi:hypothetical protein [Gordonia sp. SL306]|uniref:hypothetical protein n=1 Tax=Gordonia sp. SL306 TaxID=2995145 RepID=UPI00226DEA8C|nr:hypothetical protein [Gordonia sp. SL306]WAC54274.1 hypothetical protein OVA31_16475 [Gordonia sp. SL306]
MSGHEDLIDELSTVYRELPLRLMTAQDLSELLVTAYRVRDRMDLPPRETAEPVRPQLRLVSS